MEPITIYGNDARYLSKLKEFKDGLPHGDQGDSNFAL